MSLNPSGLLIAFFWYTEASYSQNLDHSCIGSSFDPEPPPAVWSRAFSTVAEEVIPPSFDQRTHNVQPTTQQPQPFMIIVWLCKSLDNHHI